jgi:tetratricopeptide (TPR) repeat protein
LIVLGVAWSLASPAADFKEAQQKFLSGNYTRCIAQVEGALTNGADGEEWRLLLSKALLATGRYPEALASITNALEENRWSVRVMWQAREVFQANGQTEAADRVLRRIRQTVMSQPRAYRDPPSMVVFGQALLLTGEDPKRVLEMLYDTAKKEDPTLRDVYLASGGLALEKHDFALAAQRFEEGLKKLPDDPDLQYGLAQAYAPSEPALMAAAMEAAITRNTNHTASLLLLADHSIDAEDFAAATNFLDRVDTVNPWSPDAWALRAVLAHLQNQPEVENAAREKALKFWATNPRVDHLIGRKLSQNYRFSEGAAHQRRALAFDPDYLPAKAQLAQDLLRLGEETDGWRLASEVQTRDAYDVEAYNLVNLHATMSRFATLTNQDFIVRMNRAEASIYGARVLELLERARSNLCAKYGIEVKRPAIVEVFSSQKDFAVRTFGMPGNPGYLGVCFGSVVTANSPAAHPGNPINWEAVLWHEFCHVVTLQRTQNKMPRWLSEGISVYEERQANPAWGEHLTPRYHEMILGDDLQPVSKLSAAFLAPPSAVHLQFAYYESSLVVEFLVQRFGLENLKAILWDLGQGMEINQALEKHTEPIAKLEPEFTAFAHDRARSLAPGLDFEKPAFASTNRLAAFLGETDSAAWNSWAKSRPTNYWVMTRQAEEFVKDKQWTKATNVLQRLVDLCPDPAASDNAYRLLAISLLELRNTNDEQHLLARLAEKDDTAIDAYRRLMELSSAAHDWPAVALNARRYVAVDPLVPLPYRFLAQAAEQTDDLHTAIQALRALLELNPPDPAQVHFDVARLLHRTGDPEAKRHVLRALEEAPRYRAALRLLLEIDAQSPRTKTDGTNVTVGLGQ